MQDDKLDKINDRLNSIDTTLVKNTTILEEHIRRTNLLEQKLVPVEKHVWMVNGAFKLLGIISLLVGLISGVWHLFH